MAEVEDGRKRRRRPLAEYGGDIRSIRAESRDLDGLFQRMDLNLKTSTALKAARQASSNGPSCGQPHAPWVGAAPSRQDA